MKNGVKRGKGKREKKRKKGKKGSKTAFNQTNWHTALPARSSAK